MQTVLALHGDPRLEPFLTRACGPDFSFRSLSLAESHSEPHLMQLLLPQVQLADCVLVDLVSLNILGKWVLTWLRVSQPAVPVVVRLTADQRAMAELPANSVFLFDSDPIERVRQAVATFLGHHRLQKEVQYLRETVSRRGQPPLNVTPPRTSDQDPRRESLFDLSSLLASAQDVKTLAEQALALLRKMFGVGKLAIFVREPEIGLMKTNAASGATVRCAASIGIPREIVNGFNLSLTHGIGCAASSQARIIRRDLHQVDPLAPYDPQIQREFEVLGTEFAMPVLDRDMAIGVLTFGGKVTGQTFASEELELMFHLMNQLGILIRNLWLHQDVAGQQRFMQDVLAHISSGVVVVNGRNQIAALNRRAGELLGLSEVGAVGADSSWLPAEVGDLMFETTRTGATHQQREVVLQKTGRVVSVSTSRFEVPAEAGDQSNRFSVAVIEDITELKEQHALAREMQQQEFTLQLASRLSHELKNSLVSINTFAQLLQQYERKEFRDEFFKIVANEVTRVDLLVENLTFFAHPLILRYEEVDLAELIEMAIVRLIEEYRRQHGASVVSTASGQPTITSVTGQPIALSQRCGHSAKKMACDPKRLSLALHNIMHNAIQSMPQGGRLSVVTDDAKPNGHTEPRVQISVIDTGEGIPPANLEQIFQPFFTTRNVGVGLGLTIAHKIIQKHGGNILVESKLGKGATMVITLPTKVAPPSPGASPSRESEAFDRVGGKSLDTVPRS